MDDKLYLLVIMGSDETGRKEVLAVVDGYRESEASWTEFSCRKIQDSDLLWCVEREESLVCVVEVTIATGGRGKIPLRTRRP